MATNCYGFDIDLEVCVDGPVGNGDKANLAVHLYQWAEVQGTSQTILTANDWDGSLVSATGWDDGNWNSNCDITESRVTAQLDPNVENRVNVSVRIVIDNCESSFGGCDAPGPNTFEMTQSYDLVPGQACTGIM